MNQENPNPNRWWKHRRTMAYIGIIFIILQTPLWASVSVFNPAAMASLGVVVGWSYGAPLSFVLAYFGNTLAEEIVKRKKEW